MKKSWVKVTIFFVLATLFVYAAEEKIFNGLYLNLGNLARLSHAKSRSISPENFTGEKGKGGMSVDGLAKNAARDLGQGWKVSPFIQIQPKETFVLAEIQGPGAIQQIWMTPSGKWRFSILRFYWDGEKEPSVEVPVGDFFACGWGEFAQVSSLPICVNPGSGLNSYWVMPFRKSCKIDPFSFVIKTDIAPCHRDLKGLAGLSNAMDRFLKLPHDFRFFRVSKVQTICDAYRLCPHTGEIAARF